MEGVKPVGIALGTPVYQCSDCRKVLTLGSANWWPPSHTANDTFPTQLPLCIQCYCKRLEAKPVALPLPDSGSRTKYPSGYERDGRVGKGRFDLIPPEALFRLALRYEQGAVKYGDRNWEMGGPISAFVDSAMRHLTKYLAGHRDEDHLAAVLWNVAAIMHFEKAGRTDLMDLPWQRG